MRQGQVGNLSHGPRRHPDEIRPRAESAGRRGDRPDRPQLEGAYEYIQRAFLAGIREEILVPVNAIITLSEILLADVGDEDQQSFVADLRKIEASGKHLRTMVNEFLDPRGLTGHDEEGAFAALQSRVRHDMLNALNPVVNYSEMWLEDADDIPPGFVPDLERIHAHGKRCMAVLDEVLRHRQQETPAGATEEAIAPSPEEPLFEWEPVVDRGGGAEPGYCLVVDDDATNRDILCRLLLRQGHRVATAVNGRQALEMLAEAFDLVLLDIMMPEMNGFQVLTHLKEDERLREVPVIMISALDEEDGVIRCIGLGAEDYLPKPFNPLLLRARIGACLEKKRFATRNRVTSAEIEQEKRRADELLHVILPGPIVQELKTTNQMRPRSYENVAVLFADSSVLRSTARATRRGSGAVPAKAGRSVGE